MKTAQKGFTLIEVMIVVVIIGILAAIAYPSYDEYVKRGYRTEGQAFLNDVAARQERYYSQNNTYVTDHSDVNKLGLANRNSATGKYRIRIVEGNANQGGYLLVAQQRFGDTKCGNLRLNALGEKGRTGTDKTVDECWR